MNKNKLYVGNLNYSVTSKELSDFFAEDWDVTDCKVIEGKGFAFVTFEDDQSAAAAKEKYNNSEFKGRNLKIDIAVDNRQKNNRDFASKRRY